MKRPHLASATVGAVALGLASLATRAARAEGVGVRPVDMSLDGHRSDWLFNYVTIAVTGFFIIMVAVMVIAIVAHGRKHKAVYDHGSSRKAVVRTLVIAAAIFFVVDGVMLGESFGVLREGFYKFPDGDPAALQVEVMAQQWAWNFRLPGPDGKFNTPDDVVTFNELHVPTGRPVYFKIQSKDVIHSLYFPNMRIKQDAVPGSITRLWFHATQAGVAEIGCAQHCGTNHYKMRGTLYVEEPAAWDAWYKVAVADAQRRFNADDPEAQWGWDFGAEGLSPTMTRTASAAPAAAHHAAPAEEK